MLKDFEFLLLLWFKGLEILLINKIFICSILITLISNKLPLGHPMIHCYRKITWGQIASFNSSHNKFGRQLTHLKFVAKVFCSSGIYMQTPHLGGR